MTDAIPSPPQPRHAATVMLLRERSGQAEVLVVRRHENLAFMGGLWVFPGGTLASADLSDEALACLPDSSKLRCAQLHDLNGIALERRLCLGLAVAAYRETFEETGLLLATNASGRHCSDDLLNELQAQRRAIAAQPERFPALLAQERLLLDAERLLYWAHWITPSQAPRRFDTRFFAMIAPEHQTANIDATEAVDHAWMSPAALIDAAGRGAMPLSQPTLYNVMELSAGLHLHGSLAGLLHAERDRRIAPVLPKMIRERTVMVLPWDPEYPHLPGASAPASVQYPPRLRELPSRIAFTLQAPK